MSAKAFSVRVGTGCSRWREVVAVATQLDREEWRREVSCSLTVCGSTEGRDREGMTSWLEGGGASLAC